MEAIKDSLPGVMSLGLSLKGQAERSGGKVSEEVDGTCVNVTAGGRGGLQGIRLFGSWRLGCIGGRGMWACGDGNTES